MNKNKKTHGRTSTSNNVNNLYSATLCFHISMCLLVSVYSWVQVCLQIHPKGLYCYWCMKIRVHTILETRCQINKRSATCRLGDLRDTKETFCCWAKRHIAWTKRPSSWEVHILHTLSLSLIRSPYLPRSCGHIREVAFGEREKYIDSSSAKILWHNTREGGLCLQWPQREGLLYISVMRHILFQTILNYVSNKFRMHYNITHVSVMTNPYTKSSYIFFLKSCSYSKESRPVLF